MYTWQLSGRSQPYFSTYEEELTSIDDLELRKTQVEALSKSSGLTFYWRGQADASWGVHSALHRAVASMGGRHVATVKDADVVDIERQLVSEAREWIRPSIGARLTTIDLFARLQHHGVPTRFIDFTKDPWVALFFAVASHDDADGRIIVAAARDPADERFKDSFAIPWSRREDTRPRGWGNTLVALDDHEDFLRISRQSGVFLTGGTPSTGIRRRIASGYLMGAHDVRSSMSVPLALHGWVQAEAALENRKPQGRPPTMASALTLRISAGLKAPIRAQLPKRYQDQRLFPDVRGFLDRSSALAEYRKQLNSCT